VENDGDLASRAIEPFSDLRVLVDGDAGGDEYGDGDDQT